MAELTSMKNIGKTLYMKLFAVGITSAEQLIEAGSKKAYVLLKMSYPEMCAVHLYALEGAITGVDFSELPQEKCDELSAFAASLEYKGGM